MQFAEKIIIKHCIAALLKNGFSVSVNDGEETVLRRSVDKRAILNAMASTDEDWICVHQADQPIFAGDEDTRRSFGWIRFIYGNDGWDVMNDYTTSLEDTLKSTNALADKIAL